MGINVAGMAAAFQGYQEEKRRQQDEEQRAKAAQHLEQEGVFQEEVRHRQRQQWARVDKNQALDEADVAELNAQMKAGNTDPGKPSPPAATSLSATLPAEVASVRKLDQAMAQRDASISTAPANAGVMQKLDAVADNASLPAPAKAASVLAPVLVPVIAPAAGMPQPHNFNSVLDVQQELLNRRLARGSVSPQDYAQSFVTLGKIKSEGIHQALDLMAQGDYQAGVNAYNSVGRMRGARVVEGKEGVTKINGQETPTHFVTIQNADGTRTTMDVAKARYQLLDIDRQLQHQDVAAKNQMLRDQHQAQIQLGYAKLDQEGKASTRANGLQAGQLDLAWKKFLAETPQGKISALEKTLGHPLNMDQKATLLGIDLMPQATRMQMASLLKEEEAIAQTINKAMADGTWQGTNKDGSSNPLLVRQSVINARLRQLREPQVKADVLGLSPGGNNARPSGIPPLPQVGGVAGKTLPLAAPAKNPGNIPPMTPGFNDEQTANWIKNKMLGAFDGPEKYRDIAHSAVDPQIRRVAAALYQQYLASQQEAQEGQTTPFVW